MSAGDPNDEGCQRVAAFLLSLDADTASGILRGMDEDVVAQVAQAMLELDPKTGAASVVDELYRHLARHVSGPRHVHACDSGRLESLLTKSFGAQSGQRVLDDIRRRRLQDRPFLDLEGFESVRIAAVLKHESAAVSALVLAHMDPADSADILRFFDDDRALDAVRRMATLSPPPVEILTGISAGLVERIGAAAPVSSRVADPTERLKSIAELLNYSSPDIEKSVIEALSEDDSDMANELREYMFTWEDIATIDKRAMQKILGLVDTKTLSIALKACSMPVEQNVMNNLSSRVRDMVAEERELAGPMPMTDVQSAREEIMRNIRAMIEAGEFRPSRAGEDLVA